MAVFDPAGEGSPFCRSRIGSKIPPGPQLSAPGTANELSTRVIPDTVINPLDVVVTVPGDPLIGVFGPGGLVVPVLRLRTIRLAASPRVQAGPSSPVGVLTRTSIGKVRPGAFPTSRFPRFTVGFPSSCGVTVTASGPPPSPGI